MSTNQRQNSTEVQRCGLSVKKIKTPHLFLMCFLTLKAHIMSQKKIDTLGQTQDSQDQPNVNYHKGSTLEFWRSHGILSKNTTHEKLGQTTLMFTNGSKQLVKDDSLEASIRYLRFRSFNP
jgi:hypothetical protein